MSTQPWSWRVKRRVRAAAADLVHRGWQAAIEVGAIGPDDTRGQRFHSMGARSYIAFPPGAMFGEEYISIGADTLIGPNVSLAAGMFPDEPLDVPDGVAVTIGDRCMIGRGGSIVGRCSLVIEDDVTTAPNVYITDHNHTYNDLHIPIGRQWLTEDPVRIGAGSWLGTGVVVLPGASIGRHVTVAAGSVVRGEIPDYAVVAGSPARVVRQHDGSDWVPPLRRTVETPEWWAN